MARKSIFDIASNSLNISGEGKRINRMFHDDMIYIHSVGYTIVEYIDYYVFSDWKWRGHFIDVDDFMEAIDYGGMVYDCENNDVDAFLSLIECVYNFWWLVHRDLIAENSELRQGGNFYHLEDVMKDNLQKYNYKAYLCDERILVIEDKPEVTAAAEIAEQNLSVDIIRYNHRVLKGEIESKKQILIALGAELEPRRRELQTLNKQLSEDIFFMLNNVNIRHNNKNSKDTSKYKEFVSKMDDVQLEKWYDELYQMILLAMLLLDNVDRTAEVKDLKDKITGESNNG